MFNCLFGTGAGDISNKASQYEAASLRDLTGKVEEIQKVLDAMAKVYVAERAKEIDERSPDAKWYKTDQPIIDRAKRLELERQIMVAEMELKALKQGWGR